MTLALICLLAVISVAAASCRPAKDEGPKDAKPSAAAAADEKKGMAAYKKGDFDAALKSLKSAAQATPRNSSIQRNLGLAYEANGDLDQALKAYQASLRAKPKQPEVLYNIAIIHKTLGDQDKAITELESVLKMNKDFVGARIVLAELYVSDGRTGRAIDQYNIILKAKPFGTNLKDIRKKIRAIKKAEAGKK